MEAGGELGRIQEYKIGSGGGGNWVEYKNTKGRLGVKVRGGCRIEDL